MEENNGIKLNLRALQNPTSPVSEWNTGSPTVPSEQIEISGEETNINSPIVISPDLKKEGAQEEKNHLKLSIDTFQKNSDKVEQDKKDVIAANQKATEMNLEKLAPVKDTLKFLNYESNFQKEAQSVFKRIQHFKYNSKTNIGFLLWIITLTVITIASLMIIFPEKHSFKIYKASLTEIIYGKEQKTLTTIESSGTLETWSGTQILSGSIDTSSGSIILSGALNTASGSQILSGSIDTSSGSILFSGALDSASESQILSGSIDTNSGSTILSGVLDTASGSQIPWNSEQNTPELVKNPFNTPANISQEKLKKEENRKRSLEKIKEHILQKYASWF